MPHPLYCASWTSLQTALATIHCARHRQPSNVALLMGVVVSAVVGTGAAVGSFISTMDGSAKGSSDSTVSMDGSARQSPHVARHALRTAVIVAGSGVMLPNDALADVVLHKCAKFVHGITSPRETNPVS